MKLLSNHVIALLARDAQSIARRYLGSGALGQSKPRTEPDFVAALVIGAMGDIAVAWTKHLGLLGYDLKVQAVFCHGHPQVTFPPTGRHAYSTKTVAGKTVGQCELADLLLVIDDTTGDPTGNKVLSRRAALVQAKMLKTATANKLSLSGNELAQLDLLENWPSFDFASPGYSARSRDFKKGTSMVTAIEGGSYGIIDKHQSPPNWEHDTPVLPISCGGLNFGEFFAGLAGGGSAATGRAATVGANDDWSFTIDELLDKTGIQLLNLASISANPTPTRGVDHMAFYQSTSSGDGSVLIEGATRISASGGGGEGKMDIVEPGDDDGGISAIRIVISRNFEHLRRITDIEPASTDE